MPSVVYPSSLFTGYSNCSLPPESWEPKRQRRYYLVGSKHLWYGGRDELILQLVSSVLKRYPVVFRRDFVLQWRLVLVYQSVVRVPSWSDFILYSGVVVVSIWPLLLWSDLVLYRDGAGHWSSAVKGPDSSCDPVPRIVRVFFYVLVDLVSVLTVVRHTTVASVHA